MKFKCAIKIIEIHIPAKLASVYGVYLSQVSWKLLSHAS